MIRLNDLAKDIESGKDLTVVNAPRVQLVGENTLLWEPTVGSDIWWNSIGKECTTDSHLLPYVYFFSLANSRNVDVLYKLDGSRQITKAVKKWMKTLCATEGELWSAVLYLKRLNELKVDVDAKWSDKEYMAYMYSYIIQCAGALGKTPEELMTVTRSQLIELLIQANIHAQIPMKKSVAEKYIEYTMLLKEIEGREEQENGQSA